MLLATAAAAATSVNTGPYNIVFLCDNPASLSAVETDCVDWLEAEGHTVTERDHDLTTDTTTHPSADLIIFSPGNNYSAQNTVAQANALPMLDMARSSWYTRYLVPWDDDTVTRYGAAGDWGTDYIITDDTILPNSPAAGTVTFGTTDHWSNAGITVAALNYSTDNDIQVFLTLANDTSETMGIGCYLPAGSTCTIPDDNAANEVQTTSTANWLGFGGRFIGGDSAPFTKLNAAGDDLLRSCLQKVVNG